MLGAGAAAAGAAAWRFWPEQGFWNPCRARLPRRLASRGGALGELRVADIMVSDPVTAAPEIEVNDLRRTMLESGARYLPVMQDGKLLGVISFRDVAKAVLEEQDFENKMLKGYIKNWPA